MSAASPVDTISSAASTRPVSAFVETLLTGANNDLRFEWLVPGTVGNGKTIAATISGSYSVIAVAHNAGAITITGPTGATALQIRTAIQADPTVSALISAETKSGNTGAGAMITFSALTFAGGTGTAQTAPISTID